MKCPQFKSMTVADRIVFVDQNKLCRNCFRDNHETSDCLSNNRCFCCGALHSALVHTDKSESSLVTNSNDCFMPVVKVKINDKIYVNAALDSLSSATFCSKELADQLNLKGESYKYILRTMAGNQPTESMHVSFKVSSGKECIHMSGVKVVDSIPISSANLNTADYEHLAGLDLSANINCHKVDLLIGQNYSEALLPLEVRSGPRGAPYAVKYLFGWGLSGKCQKVDVSHAVVCNFVSASPVHLDTRPADPSVDINRLWEFENIGYDRPGMSVEDRKVIDLWDNTCRKINGHYELPIPWRDANEDLPNNFALAIKRLESLVSRLKREDLFTRYDREISVLLESEYAEVVPEDEIYNAKRIFYLPHHCVQNQNKPDKLRIVFDCAAKCEGRSLNERCLQGSDLINKLLFVLLRFRLHKFAIQGDIVSMYNQCLIPPHDRDALRFLWYRDDKLIHLRMTRHLFGGIWCSSSSTYALRKTVLDNPHADKLVKDAILRSMYVDDLTLSVMSIQDVNKIIVGEIGRAHV